MCQVGSLRENDTKVFLRREWVSITILFALVTLGNRLASAMVLLVAASFIAFTILLSSVEDAFCWAIALIPNIRMLDMTGVTFLVNALMALPIVVYFARLGVKKLSSIAVLGTLLVFAIEFLHDMVLCDLGNLVSIAGWSLNIFLCIQVTVDSRVKIAKNDIFSALSSGIIMSAMIYFASGLENISHIVTTINSGTRFTAFASDPNYYSLYICLAISCILSVSGKGLYKFIVMILLVAVGLLTASKMCFILMIVEFAIMFLQLFNEKPANKDNRRFVFISTLGLIVVLIVFKDYVHVFVQNFIRRAGQTGDGGIDWDTLTTGRSRIVLEYINVLFTNWQCTLFGYGFSYHLFLGNSTGHGAHNTYLDIFLAWGLLGTIVFTVILYCWLKKYISKRHIKKIAFVNKIPTIILLINFLDLSCFSASMFPFVLTVAMMQWLPTTDS